jgi:hypothetical protein
VIASPCYCGGSQCSGVIYFSSLLQSSWTRSYHLIVASVDPGLGVQVAVWLSLCSPVSIKEAAGDPERCTFPLHWLSSFK